ncbi:hypothetical protein [Nitrospirillum sp. BR 11828]|uniref:hypothetical protein n=1 Tax=Nitrospirillum sp. BR 11828 TaxID=3104325 RepID=UPI002ACA09A5|nr:hypothetical protein [Nitrospirillum sp. BR 11828]MDZ5648931.1 hypothetical protein [Nitrospirillum sp. BR 11828]
MRQPDVRWHTKAWADVSLAVFGLPQVVIISVDAKNTGRTGHRKAAANGGLELGIDTSRAAITLRDPRRDSNAQAATNDNFVATRISSVRNQLINVTKYDIVLARAICRLGRCGMVASGGRNGAVNGVVAAGGLFS